MRVMKYGEGEGSNRLISKNGNDKNSTTGW